MKTKLLILLIALLFTACELVPTEPTPKYDKQTEKKLIEHNQGGGE
ncbi:MAG: hypothetical protein FD143_3667 [Ignavibacteria bacterium]|nr:MAG: hypothetical protein FD143_3667 [Ignavibacteria bacterium]